MLSKKLDKISEELQELRGETQRRVARGDDSPSLGRSPHRNAVAMGVEDRRR